MIRSQSRVTGYGYETRWVSDFVRDKTLETLDFIKVYLSILLEEEFQSRGIRG